MKKYRVTADSKAIYVEGLYFLWWITIKKFSDEDNSYALRCAYELLEKLEEKI